MLLCLSSGFTRRYRHDVLRAIAMPSGTRFHFRYELGLIPDGLQAPISRNEFKGEDLCLAYLDRTDPNRPPEVIPCRAAKVVETKTIGDFCTIEFELSGFYLAPDLAAFNSQLSARTGYLPHWKDDGKLSGHFCHQLDSNPASLRSTCDISDWQELVKQLSNRKDFASEPFLYHVRGLYVPGQKDAIAPDAGIYRVKGGTSYEIRVIHYTPGETHDRVAVEDVNWLVADADPANISFITTTSLAIDSAYDEKKIRFRTLSATGRQDSVVSVFRRIGGAPSTTDATWDFDLQLGIRPRLVQGVFLAVLIALPSIVLIWTDPKYENKVVSSLLVLIAAGLAGFAANYFGLKKPG
jgi:hypothetical protein